MRYTTMDWIRDYGAILLLHFTNLALLLAALQIKAQIGTSPSREAMMSNFAEVEFYVVAAAYCGTIVIVLSIWLSQGHHASKNRRTGTKSHIYVV